jgi:hypothetical protein
MAEETYVALFPSAEAAEAARHALEAAGIAPDSITVTVREAAGPLTYATAATAEATAAAPHGAAGIFDWFFTSDPPVAAEGDVPLEIGEETGAVLSLVAEAADRGRIARVLGQWGLVAVPAGEAPPGEGS